MNIDTGLGVVILSVLVFYLRLIVMQRERVKQVRHVEKTNSGRKKKEKVQPSPDSTRYSILSPRTGDRILGGVGVALILLGILLYAGLLHFPALQTYWWVPTSIGIVAFSWLFRL